MNKQVTAPSDGQPAHAVSDLDELPDEVFERAAALRRAGASFVLATVVWSQRPTSAKPGAKAIITPDGAITGWIGGSCAQTVVVREALSALADGRTRLVRLSADGESADRRAGVVTAAMTCHSGGALEIFVEPCQPVRQLVIVGESPVATALQRLGEMMGYRTVIIQLAPTGAALELAALPALIGSGQTSVVVASMGQYDDEAVTLALQAGAEAVALVASPRRAAVLVDWLRQRGFDEALLARLKAPAGLDIGAATPAEVAVSIIAEIIARQAPAARRTPMTPPPASEASTARATSTPPPVETITTLVPVTVARPGADPEMAVDPVCGMMVAVAGTRQTAEHAGTRYYFCCPSCRRQFEREPHQFLAGVAS